MPVRRQEACSALLLLAGSTQLGEPLPLFVQHPRSLPFLHTRALASHCLLSASAGLRVLLRCVCCQPQTLQIFYRMLVPV